MVVICTHLLTVFIAVIGDEKIYCILLTCLCLLFFLADHPLLIQHQHCLIYYLPPPFDSTPPPPILLTPLLPPPILLTSLPPPPILLTSPLPPPILLTPLPPTTYSPPSMLHDISSLQKYGESPLYAAAINDHDAIVAVLLSHGADVNQANHYGRAPLYVAVGNNHDAVIAVLLSHGADVNQADNDGLKPIDVANQKTKDMLYAHMKKKHQESQQPVDELLWFAAAEKGDLAVIQQGINDKIDVNCQDREGCTAVWLAAWRGHEQLLEYLISQQADLSIANVSAHDVYLSISILLTSLPPPILLTPLLPPLLTSLLPPPILLTPLLLLPPVLLLTTPPPPILLLLYVA